MIQILAQKKYLASHDIVGVCLQFGTLIAPFVDLSRGGRGAQNDGACVQVFHVPAEHSRHGNATENAHHRCQYKHQAHHHALKIINKIRKTLPGQFPDFFYGA